MPRNPTPAQQEASRRNGAQSHGPQDTSRTRYNALRHGLLSGGLVFTSEEQQQRFIALHHDLVADLAPQGPPEDLLVERIATCYQRLGRAAQLIAFWSLPSTEQRAAVYEGYLIVNWELYQQTNMTTTGATLLRYERALDRELYTALRTLQTLQARRRASAAHSSVLARLRGEARDDGPSAAPDAWRLPPDACPPLGFPEQSGPADALCGRISGSFRSITPDPESPQDAFTRELLAALEGGARREGWDQTPP